MKHLKLIIPGFILSVFLFTACNMDENVLPENKGRINVHLTDSPFPINLINSTLVTIDKVEIRKRLETDLNGSSDTFIVLSEEEMQINLLELTNGITEEIASADLEPGTYDLIRLHVVDATVLLNDGTTFDLKVPSGYTSGLKIKINPAIYLGEGQTSDVLLDFDVSKSFVVKGKIGGHINGFNFKPVVRAVYMGAAGRIEGNVSDTTGIVLENAMVKVLNPDDEMENAGNDELEESGDDNNLENNENDNNHIVSSFTDVAGNYKLIGLPEGTYSVVCELEGYENDTIKDVTVTAGNATTVNFQLEKKAETVASVFN